ncbi:MAG TPA: radical SAM protein [Pyrinomonadaceae bacterium]|nr:radical SAM protein [Pyrinomonadaceae bacterium]
MNHRDVDFDFVNQADFPPIAEFVELVRATDADAEHRLLLVEQAAPVLYAAATISVDKRESLAEKFERWRYQRLNRYAPRLSENERRLSAVLDFAAGKILQSHPRPPKAPRLAIHSDAYSESEDQAARSADFAGFEAAFDPHVPLEEIARKAAALTARHFRSPLSVATPLTARANELAAHDLPMRWRMRLYAPLYLSNYCVNHCLYCAFRFPNELDRVHLSVDEAMAEAEVLRTHGHRHLLVVAGDFPKLTSIDYLSTIIRELAAREFSVAVEVAPQGTVSYAKMVRAGASGVTLYQETYQEELYSRLHPRGPKVWFDWRLEAPERAAEAGMKRIGLGILLGLADPALDIRCLIRHGQYLLDRFPEVKLAFSLPRIHEAPDSFKSAVATDDETFIRLYCALRFSFPTADLVLSTREPPSLRDQLARVCITQMSAGSCTAPGGYAGIENGSQSREQFPVFDHRTASQVAVALERSGFDLSWDIRDD